MTDELKKEALKCAVDLMEIETIYFTGKSRAITRRKYHRLLRMCGKNCHFDDPIYLNRK